MSNEVFPSSLPGWTLDIERDVLPPPVAIKATPSRREFRARSSTITLYAYKLKAEFLRSGAAFNELQTLVGFYNMHGGPFDSWLYLDPDDNAATNAQFAIGDGATTTFQVLRQFGGFSEPVTHFQSFAVTYKDEGGTVPLQASVRGNRVLYSEDFSNSVWSSYYGGTGLSAINSNALASPFGDMVADTLVDDTNGSYHYTSQTVAADPNAEHVFSVYLRPGTKQWATIRIIASDNSGDISANFNLATATVGATLTHGSGVIYQLGCELCYGNWVRCSISGFASTTAAPGSSTQVGIFMANGNTPGIQTYAGTGTGTMSAYGAQLDTVSDTGLLPMRYVKTLGAVAYTSYDWPAGAYLVGPLNGVLALSFTPRAGSTLTWSGNFYRRCRFSDQKLSTPKFMQQLFTTGVSFQSTLDLE